MSRTAKIARALTIGYGFQAVVAVTGLVLTPFLLSRLGAADYGRWLVVGQLLGLLALLDLGVTAVLPREVARASGDSAPGAVAAVVRRAAWLVALQTPVVALAALGVWVWASGTRPELSEPLAVILIVFVVQFPLRLPAAVLNGLQDLTFNAAVIAVGWALSTAVTVGLVLAGWGLGALAAGWATGQVVGCAASAVRLRARCPGPVGLAWPGRAALREQFHASVWTSAAQLSQLLVAGTDLLVLAWVLGPAAAVAYSCTTKLVALLSNQCYAIGLTAQPALAQLRAGNDQGRLRRALRATGLAMLVVSGGVAIGVVAVNGAFVTRWVGADQFAGPDVTLLAVLAMLIRHLGFTWLNAAYVLGAERRLAVITLADGAVTVAASVGWASAVGVAGAALGSLTGALLVHAPLGLLTVARRLEVSPGRVLAWAGPWAALVVGVLVPVAIGSRLPEAQTVSTAAALAVLGGCGYTLGVSALSGREPLREYRERVTSAVRRRWARRINQPTPDAAESGANTAPGRATDS